MQASMFELLFTIFDVLYVIVLMNVFMWIKSQSMWFVSLQKMWINCSINLDYLYHVFKNISMDGHYWVNYIFNLYGTQII